MSNLNMQVVGVREALHALRELPRRVHNKHVRIGMNKGAGILRDAARRFARFDTGTLKKSLTIKVKVPDASFNVAHHGKPAYAVIGPARGKAKYFRRSSTGRLRGFGAANREFKVTVNQLRQGGAPGRAISSAARRFVSSKFTNANLRNPSRYAHIVERGGRRHKSRPFLGMATATNGQRALIETVQKINSGLMAEAQALGARARFPLVR